MGDSAIRGVELDVTVGLLSGRPLLRKGRQFTKPREVPVPFLNVPQEPKVRAECGSRSKACVCEIQNYLAINSCERRRYASSNPQKSE